MLVTWKFIASDRRVDLFDLYKYTSFVNGTSQDYVPKTQIRLIEKALDVGSH